MLVLVEAGLHADDRRQLLRAEHCSSVHLVEHPLQVRALESVRFASLPVHDTQELLPYNEDVDMPESIMTLSAARTGYEAVLESAAKIQQVSLVDFLK